MSEEGNDGEIGEVPVVAKIDGESDGRIQRKRDMVQLVEFADNRRMLKCLAGILAGADGGVQTFFGYRNPQIKR